MNFSTGVLENSKFGGTVVPYDIAWVTKVSPDPARCGYYFLLDIRILCTRSEVAHHYSS